MTFVAPEAGHQIIGTVFIEQIAVVGVGNPCTCHGNHIQLSFRNGFFRHLRIEPAANIGNYEVQILLLDSFRQRQERHGIQFKGNGMVIVAVCRANLDDIHILLRLLQELDALFHGVAALGLLCGKLNLNEHIVARNLLDLLQHQQREPAAVLKAAAELVGAEIGERRQQLTGHLGAVAHMDGHGVKAQTLI